MHNLPDFIGKRMNVQQAGGMSYTGIFLGLGEHQGHKCVIMKLTQIYFIPLEWITSVFPREDKLTR